MPTKLSPLTVTRLRRIARAIRMEPLRYNQNNAAIPDSCGSAGCIFGWAVRLYGTAADRREADMHGVDLYRVGARLLGIESKNRSRDNDMALFKNSETRLNAGRATQRAARLFYTEFWPAQFQMDLLDGGPISSWTALVAQARIYHFIITNGRE